METKENDPDENVSVNISARQRRAAESILENEAIREGLDDSGASALLNWGVQCAKRIIKEATADIEDEDEADEEAYPRMRALRQMLDDVKSLLRPDLLPTEAETLMTEIVEFAQKVYGPEAQLPQFLGWEIFSANPTNDTGEKINMLRDLLENNSAVQGE